MKVLGLDEAVGPWPMLYSFWPLDRRPVSSCLTRRVRPGTGYHKTPHSRRRVVSRIETSLRTTAHQLLTLSSTKESGCMHSLSVLKCMGAHPLAGRALLHLTSLRLNAPPAPRAKGRGAPQVALTSVHGKRALPHWGTAARVGSRWSFRCPCVSRFTMHRVIAMMLSSLPEDHRRFRFNLGL